MSAEPITVGRYAPYTVWFTVTLVVRAAQILFLLYCAWGLVALFDAMDRSSSTLTPPLTLGIILVMIGASGGHSHWRGKTSPMGDFVGKLLASEQCPACGQDIFDHSSGTGYATPSDRQRMFPSRYCANRGHDLTVRTAAG